jgi:gas vesicle protein
VALGKDGISFLAGVLTGIAFGSAAALLLAPRPGRDTRERLAKDAKRLAVRVSGLHPVEWSDLEVEDNGRNLVANLDGIRAAGL